MEVMTDEKVLEEIERLKASPYVKLAKKTENQAQRQNGKSSTGSKRVL